MYGTLRRHIIKSLFKTTSNGAHYFTFLVSSSVTPDTDSLPLNRRVYVPLTSPLGNDLAGSPINLIFSLSSESPFKPQTRRKSLPNLCQWWQQVFNSQHVDPLIWQFNIPQLRPSLSPFHSINYTILSSPSTSERSWFLLWKAPPLWLTTQYMGVSDPAISATPSQPEFWSAVATVEKRRSAHTCWLWRGGEVLNLRNRGNHKPINGNNGPFLAIPLQVPPPTTPFSTRASTPHSISEPPPAFSPTFAAPPAAFQFIKPPPA